MRENLEYIDAYFQKELSDADRLAFEERCVSDEEFASDVAFYISSRAELQDILLDEKKREWSSIEIGKEEQEAAPVVKMNVKKWVAWAVAACVIMALIIYPMISTVSPNQYAKKYIDNDLQTISQTMDASSDSLQTGIAAYNRKDYSTALSYFEGYYQTHPDNNFALQYIGQTYLLSEEYEQAIQTFEKLSAKQGLFSNPGLFLTAVTLLQRNANGDRPAAKSILEKVVNEQLEGSQTAKEWLEDWPE